MTTLLFALSALCMVTYGLRFSTLGPQTQLTPALIKTLSVALLALIAAIGGAPALILGGLILGGIGDFALARPSEKAFLAGMGAFALGHLAYALAFAPLPPHGGQWVLLAALALLVLSTELWLAPYTGPLRAPVRAYAVIIALMVASAVLMPAGPTRAWVQLGAALFVASDVLLALALFPLAQHPTRKILSRLLWPCYWAGQALILAGHLPQQALG